MGIADRLTAAIESARRQVPSAFRDGGVPPHADGIIGLREPLRAAEGALSNLITPADEGDLEDLHEAIRELGIKALAFYVSFHSPLVTGDAEKLWGIFYIAHRIGQLSADISRRLGPPIVGSRTGWPIDLALCLLRRHELFHFRFDVYALHKELTLGKPLYNHYHDAVYRKVFCTKECYEESLANHACVSGSEWPRSVEKDSLLKENCRQFIRAFCKEGPPGYRDFTRPLVELRSALGGQLLYAPGARLQEPQASWVGHAGPFGRRENCPEYILVNRTSSRNDGPLLMMRGAGYVWQFHKADPDPWPSRPHGHDYDYNAKLDLASGDVYRPASKGEGRVVDRLKDGALRDIRRRLKRKWPDVTLPPIPASA